MGGCRLATGEKNVPQPGDADNANRLVNQGTTSPAPLTSERPAGYHARLVSGAPVGGVPRERREHEAHVSAKQPPPQANTWVSQAHEHENRQGSPEKTPSQGPEAPFRVVKDRPRAPSGSRERGGVRRGSESFSARPDSAAPGVPQRAAAGRPRPWPSPDSVRASERSRPEPTGDYRHAPDRRGGAPEQGQARDARALPPPAEHAGIRSGRVVEAWISRRSIHRARVRLSCHTPAAWEIPSAAAAGAQAESRPWRHACCWSRLGPIR